MRNVIPWLVLAALVLLGMSSCERVDDVTDAVQAEVTVPLTTIPAEYGELEAVTVMPEYPGWFQLWFEDEAGTIREVRIHPSKQLMHRDVEVIARSGQTMATEEEE